MVQVAVKEDQVARLEVGAGDLAAGVPLGLRDPRQAYAARRRWRPGTPPPTAIDPDLPSADIRIGYARCSTLEQELDSQLDALSTYGVPRDKFFSEKISIWVRVRPKFEEALRAAREVKAHRFSFGRTGPVPVTPENRLEQRGHPRRRGEQTFSHRSVVRQAGPSRAGGKQPPAVAAPTRIRGPSPHPQRAADRLQLGPGTPGIHPRGARSRRCAASPSTPPRDHPRAGREQEAAGITIHRTTGSSPRARGAGGHRARCSARRRDHPRAGGEQGRSE
ncbi:recombinase family protein [Kitasatospora cineracea]